METPYKFLPLTQTVQPLISAQPCELAGAGNPLDVTIPDDTPILPGQRFVKTWRLVNLGTCVWDGTYSVVWVSGDNLAPFTSYALFNRVLPGESTDISIEMVAPLWQGRYTSYWMLRSPSGKLFGLGPAGNAPFWVRIQVPSVNTATLLSSLTVSPVIVTMQGQVRLTGQQGVDLESGTVWENTSAVDLWIERSDEGLMMILMGGAQWGVFPAAEPPSPGQCLELAKEEMPLPLEAEAFFPSLCIQTGSGNVAYLQISRVDRMQDQVELTYLLWTVP
ncbi:NBR1-Ig-like domain-containing protein [uncultured Thermanaerothrix sp.]|uniref:NBR1-Ig-like domain-containing protein n=1 Tax=uncultured Thermanaerothrix sp. TaxID=1195149 RepID=UPI00261B6A2B|nr:NBR1-Ig-like domain-containing protein [uncultured Thermanaerothrix sp.]